MLNYIKARLKERSTYAGLAALIAIAGRLIDPVKYDAVANVVVSIASAVAILTKESKNDKL